MSGIRPSSALGSAISKRIVVSNVLMLTDGSHEPYHSSNMTAENSIVSNTDAQNHASCLAHLGLHFQRVETDPTGIVNVRMVNGRHKAHLWRLKRVTA